MAKKIKKKSWYLARPITIWWGFSVHASPQTSFIFPKPIPRNGCALKLNKEAFLHFSHFWWGFQKIFIQSRAKSGLCYVTPKLKKHHTFQTVKVRQIVKVSHHYHPLKPRNCGAILPTKELPLNGSWASFRSKDLSLSFLLLYRKQK